MGLDAGRCSGSLVNEIPSGHLRPGGPAWTRLGPHVPVREASRQAPARGEGAVARRVRAPGRHAGAVPAAVGAQCENVLVVLLTHRDLAVPRLEFDEQVLSRIVPEAGDFPPFPPPLPPPPRDPPHPPPP